MHLSPLYEGLYEGSVASTAVYTIKLIKVSHATLIPKRIHFSPRYSRVVHRLYRAHYCENSGTLPLFERPESEEVRRKIRSIAESHTSGDGRVTLET